jgi:hypothetical protein
MERKFDTNIVYEFNLAKNSLVFICVKSVYIFSINQRRLLEKYMDTFSNNYFYLF